MESNTFDLRKFMAKNKLTSPTATKYSFMPKVEAEKGTTNNVELINETLKDKEEKSREAKKL